MPSVYVLHYDKPLYGYRRHYVGYCGDAHPAKRILQHMTGRGSSDTKAALKAGIKLTLAVHWSGSRADMTFERFIKNGMDTPQWCPLCAKNLKPIPQLTDATPEETARRQAAAELKTGKKQFKGAALTRPKYKPAKVNHELNVDEMIFNSYGANFRDKF